MYPRDYFNLFPAFPREDKIFVAMSFDPRFQFRWEKVIFPAIQRVELNGIPLQPHRVDTRQISDSILTEILNGISNDRLIYCDITSMGEHDGRPVRNGNVMYELGLAHATRLPEEVLLFRSDNDYLLFDMANIRVNSYLPEENPDQSQVQIGNAIISALREIDLKRHLAVKSVSESLDFTCWLVLAEAHNSDGIQKYETRTFAQAIGNAPKNNAITKLLELGAISTCYQKITPELLTKNPNGQVEQLLKYFPTPFGTAIFDYSANALGFPSLDIQLIEELINLQDR
jgi:hypothetical protein